ncbi:hypothetical protein BCV70DRAFT_200631 [Testicularia cyperi]|uniref:CBM1 domain-containing protein n=1 Tax=Testicularia cyperi TaxID=1882483 RepID=A0A317XN21_9BASI|nr:hypothetical protein BCV70DRAFT_200631 [Testicularia cyperi]
MKVVVAFMMFTLPLMMFAATLMTNVCGRSHYGCCGHRRSVCTEPDENGRDF